MAMGSGWADSDGVLPKAVPMRRPFWAIGLVLLIACLSAMAVVQAQGPSYEAQAVVQVRPGTDVIPLIEARLMGRDALLAIGLRQGITGADAAVTLRSAVALHDLTSAAGATLGLAPEVSGVVLSVRLSQPDQAVRVANDLALQVLDLGQSGALDRDHDLLEFYRTEEERLWQEVSALRAELSAAAKTGSVSVADGALGKDRKLALLRDQYDLVRHDLAVEEVASRLAARQRASQFALLQRATTAQVLQTGHVWMLCVLAASALLALLVAFGIGGRRVASRPDWPPLKSRMQGGYLMVDDPDRPIFGMPRFVVLTIGVVALLGGLSVVLR